MIPQSLSKRIDTTRLVMILAVIAIHCNISTCISSPQEAPAAMTIVELFSVALPSVAVPFFFFVSAYLLQTRHSGLAPKQYLLFIRKRAKSILIPYLIWNIIAVLLRYAVNLTPLNRYTGGGPQFDSFADMILDVFWTPELIPLWFLRNLILFFLLVPLWQALMRLSPALLVIAGFFIETEAGAGGFFYFACGMAAAKWWPPYRFESYISRLSWFAPLYCVVKICMTLWEGAASLNPLLQESVILLGIFGFMGLCCQLPRALRHFDIAGSIFFVYAFHGIISPYIIKGLAMIAPWHGLFWIADYLLTFLLTTTVSFGIYVVVKRLLPRLTPLLTGGR